MKKCEYCHYEIDTSKGHYVNVYTNPWEMHSFHIACYNDYIAMKQIQKRQNKIPGHQESLEKFVVGPWKN